MPIETLIHYNQALYYKALQESHHDGVDCRPFIDFMLGVIENSLYKYVDLATETMKAKDAGQKAIADIPVNVPVNVTVNALQQKVLILLSANPRITSQKIAHTLGVTDRTIKRALKTLREAGVIKRVGSDPLSFRW
ncbi:MAG: winged helix-turn-helix transcriptional regulator [Kiritimatiellae bacterium]|nr:winged helix-turn-helix transcriptional regulator [Kiritimatiellia bacterium]